MRIIAGSLGGRVIRSPRSAQTHPMSDKVRGALFNMLGDITDLTVLDAFAGSGALGLEAVSRGSGAVIALDNDRTAHQTITENITSLGVSTQVKAIQATAASWSKHNLVQTFDIIIADPPFNRLQIGTLAELVKHLAPQGIFVLSWPGKQPAPLLSGLLLTTERAFGDAQLLFYSAT